MTTEPSTEAIYYPGLEQKSFPSAVQDTTPQGLVTAQASVFRTPDDPPPLPGIRRDIVHDEAFDETLAERKSANRIAHIYNHRWEMVLGSHVDIWVEKGRGLMAKSQHNLNGFWGNEIFQLIRNGDISAYSFQFIPKRNTREKKSFEVDAEGIRHLYRVNLYELGPTPNAIAIHPDARVLEAKSGLYTDTSFLDLMTQAENVWMQLVTEAEALVARREGRAPTEGRKALGPDHIEAIEAQVVNLNDLASRLQKLTVRPEGAPADTPAPTDREVKSIKGLAARRDLALERLRLAGVTIPE